jgi:hypothetical protein
MTKNFILFSFFILAIFAFSCEEPVANDPPPTTQETLAALSEYSLVNKLFADAFSETDDAAKYSDDQIDGDKNGSKVGYPIITITPLDAVTWPKTVTVDYGADNFLCQDGRLRRGVITFETTGFYRNPGTEVTITFQYQPTKNNYQPS